MNPSGRHRVDAYRFLTQNLGQAFDLALETRDTRYPALHVFSAPTRKPGGDYADFTYQQVLIDGHSTYGLAGTRGAAKCFNVTVQGPRTPGPGVLHEPFGDTPEANLSGHQLHVDGGQSGGEFELYIGGPERGPNWLPTTPRSRKLFIRQGFDGWDELPAQLRIEPIDISSPKPLPTPGDMVGAMRWAGDFVVGLMTDRPEYPFAHGGVDPARPNAFPHVGATDTDSKRGRAAANLYWELRDDEALIIEFGAHDGLWMLTTMGVFFNSMDYLYRPVSSTPSRTKADRDGRIRLVMAHRDPGVHNWPDTQGFARANPTYRHMLDGEPAAFTPRLVRYNDLPDALPGDTAMVTPEERSAALWERFRGIRRRYVL